MLHMESFTALPLSQTSNPQVLMFPVPLRKVCRHMEWVSEQSMHCVPEVSHRKAPAGAKYVPRLASFMIRCSKIRLFKASGAFGNVTADSTN